MKTLLLTLLAVSSTALACPPDYYRDMQRDQDRREEARRHDERMKLEAERNCIMRGGRFYSNGACIGGR